MMRFRIAVVRAIYCLAILVLGWLLALAYVSFLVLVFDKRKP